MKRNIIIAMVLIALVGGGAVAWRSLNKGTVVMTGNAPFSVQIAGVRRLNCTTSPCDVRLQQGTYTFVVEKTGFLPDRRVVSVGSRKKMDLSLSLRRIPSIETVGAYVTYAISDTVQTNVDSLPFPLPTVSRARLVGLPGGTTTLIFSPQGTVALGETKRGPFIYDVATAAATELSLRFTAAAWQHDASGFYFLSAPEQLERQSLSVWDRKTGATNLVAVFPRAIARASLSVAPSGKRVAVFDHDMKRLYVVDVEKKTRTALLTDPLLSDAAWMGDDFVAVALGQPAGGTRIHLFFMDGSRVDTPIRTSLAATVWNGGRVVFATQQRFSIAEPKELLVLNLAADSGDTTVFGEFDPATGVATFLAEPTEALVVERFGVSDLDSVAFLSGGTVYRLLTGR